MCGPHHCLGRDAFASGPEILRRLLQWRQNASILEQGCAGHSPNSANRKHQITRHPWRTSPPLRPSLSFRYTQRVPSAVPLSSPRTDPTSINVSAQPPHNGRGYEMNDDFWHARLAIFLSCYWSLQPAVLELMITPS